MVISLEKALSLEVPIRQGFISSFEPGVLEPMQEFTGIALHQHASLAIDLCRLGDIADCRAVHIYTDGSAVLDTRASWAAVLVGITAQGSHILLGTLQGVVNDHHHCRSFAPCRLSAASAEVLAIFWSLAWLFFTKFTGAAAVHSDSQFAIAVAASTSRAQHMPAISELTAALASFIQQQQCTLCFNWVKAHAGHPWNEFADSLAGAVADQQQLSTRLPQVATLHSELRVQAPLDAAVPATAHLPFLQVQPSIMVEQEGKRFGGGPPGLALTSDSYLPMLGPS